MADKKNFLLGFGERLTQQTDILPSGGPKKHPYTPEQARERLLQRTKNVAHSLDALPAKACPHNNSVAVMTVHPAYIAKTYHPERLFKSTGLRAIGSKAVKITPERTQRKVNKESVTSQFFVAGERENFKTLFNRIETSHDIKLWEELIKFEDIRPLSVEERIKPLPNKTDFPLLEIVLHADNSKNSEYIVEGFRDYLKDFDINVDLDKRIYAGGLCFLSVRASEKLISDIASYSFLRVLREMPSLRQFQPLMRAVPGQTPFEITLPTNRAHDNKIKVAVFDGGVASDSVLQNWVTSHEVDVSKPVPEALEHGIGVTSALLFGQLNKTVPAATPFCNVDHYRVIDQDTLNNPQDNLFAVLNRITKTLTDKKYDFVNLSLGPDLPIEDDDVHVWTAKLDDLLSHGQTLTSVAVGNSGHHDHTSGNARIQPPADCVNALSVGASDSLGDVWQRAEYSSIGPGRTPGVIKPDILAFGGSGSYPFWVIDNDNQKQSYPTMGTSFSAPTALRAAIGVKAWLGDNISPLAVKALLINTSNSAKHELNEVGWGRIHDQLEDIVVCNEAEVRVLYQGNLNPAECIRAQIPLPQSGLNGFVEISATLCYATQTDPQDPINYTRSGIDIKFRPNDQMIRGKHNHVKAKPFFQKKDAHAEDEMRDDAHKWETVLHKLVRMRASSLNNPVFDIHYNARKEGGATKQGKPIPYALVVKIKCQNLPDIYDRVVTKYRTILEPMVPVIDIPVTV